MEILSYIWNEGIIRPMINSLVLLYYVCFGNFGLSIIVFTVLIRSAMIPLSVKQSRQMKAMSSLQPKIRAIQTKYAKDKARQSQDTMKLYREQGVNPIGCLGPMVIQMPIFFGLFWALRGTLPSTPERLAELSRHLYTWLPKVNEVVPLDGTFLFLDLGKYSSENPVPLLLPVLVGSSMWLMQKMSTTPAATPQQESTNRMMLWMLPLMFGFFTLSFESGLALYWIMSNIVGIVIQGFVAGWGPLLSLVPSRLREMKAEDAEVPPSVEEEETDAGREPEPAGEAGSGVERKDTRRGNRARPKTTRRRAQGRRNRRR